MINRFLPITFLMLCFSWQLDAQNPGNRDHLGFAYDSQRNVLVLYGGNDADESGEYFWDPSTWEWDGTSWEKVDDNTPGKLSSVSMIYDPSSNVTIMPGGLSPDEGNISRTSLWNGETWIKYTGKEPSNRYSTAIAYDKKNKEVVMFSGCFGDNPKGDTWVFRNQKWTRVATTGPSSTCRAAMFYDSINQKIMLFGGSMPLENGRQLSNEMWAWDGKKWEQIDQGDLIPSPRANMQIVFDENRGKAVMYGGSNRTSGTMEELWEWDGTSWELIEKEGTWPGPKQVYGAVYHKGLKKYVMYGGRAAFAKPQAGLWSWNGKKWKILD